MLEQWLTKCCVLKPGTSTLFLELFSSWSLYAKTINHEAVGQYRDLSAWLQGKGFYKFRTKDGMCFNGIAIKGVSVDEVKQPVKTRALLKQNRALAVFGPVYREWFEVRCTAERSAQVSLKELFADFQLYDAGGHPHACARTLSLYIAERRILNVRRHRYNNGVAYQGLRLKHWGN